MAHVTKPRVGESCTTTGTGTITLGGALTAHKTFASACAVGDTVFYDMAAVDANGADTGDWEEGLGTYALGDTLERTTVLNSSTGLAVSFSAGTKYVRLIAEPRQVAAVPRGGSTGQALTKVNGTDYNTQWSTVATTAASVTNTPAGNIAATDVQAALNELDTEKQAVLVSATNIKTINSSSILGSGDLAISGMNLGANTFTDVQTISEAVAASSTDGVVLATSTAATVGAQKWSPRIRWTGSGWKTNATAAAQVVEWIAEVQPIQGAANPTSSLVFSSQVNGGGYTAKFSLSSGGAAIFDDTSSPQLCIGGTTYKNSGFSLWGQLYPGLTSNGNLVAAAVSGEGLRLYKRVALSGSYVTSSAEDVALERQAAGLLEINNGTATTYRDLKLRGLWFGSTLTVATLPSAAASEGLIYRVSDSNAPAVGATVAAGGSTKCTVQSNATNWVVVWI